MLAKISSIAMFSGIALQFVTLCVWAWVTQPGATPRHRRWHWPIILGFSGGALVGLVGLAVALAIAREEFAWESGAGVCAFSAMSAMAMVVEFERTDDRPLGNWPITVPGRLALAAAVIGVIAMAGFTVVAAVTGETYQAGQ